MSERILSGIYVIRNTVNGKVYVGSATSMRQRFIWHKRDLRRGAHHSSLLQRAWNKYGEAAFAFSCLELVERKEDLIEREQVWIDQLGAADRANGYNICVAAGSRLGIRHTEKARLMMAVGHAKLTEEQAKAVLVDRRPYAEIGADYNVAVTTIASIKQRVSWGRLDVGVVKGSHRGCKGAAHYAATITESDVRAIRASTEKGSILAKRYGVSPATICDIRKRRSWRHID